jgi:limonene-1,2-epoxide hydrolase
MTQARTQIVRDYIDSLGTGDLDKVLALLAQDASYRLNALQEPAIGTDAIRTELERQSKTFANFRTEISNLAASEKAVITERIDSFEIASRPVRLHWVGVFEFDGDDRIRAVRDYFDSKELESQLAD